MQCCTWGITYTVKYSALRLTVDAKRARGETIGRLGTQIYSIPPEIFLKVGDLGYLRGDKKSLVDPTDKDISVS